ncbi:MAG: RiPP maturation radical SAM C-methyltransferase [Desulforhopalus sp.]
MINMESTTASSFRLGLISMPWSIFNRPSIQLASLKSYVQRDTKISVDAFHPYLGLAREIGLEQYSRISGNPWAGEALFAPLLFSDKREDAEKLYHRCFKGQQPQPPSFPSLVKVIEQGCDQWLEKIDLSQYSLLGFSICFSQLLPSLYMAKKIKETHDQLPIVFGGSSCSGEVGASLNQHFPQIDFIIDGEGEDALLSLCNFLRGESYTLRESVQTVTPIPVAKSPTETLDLNDQPYPDYTSYFQEVQQVFPENPFIPVLPIEFSRGCWWNKCTFCNLNLQWHNYRFKKGDRMAKETLHLARTFQSLHFTFTDNALPPNEADSFFQYLAESEMDFDFFAEIRGVTEPKRLELFKKGGLNTVQVGIEALSSSLLKKMAKGVKVIDNIAVMKLCSRWGITLEGNLITDFPTTTQEEIAETLHNLDFVLPFSPLQTAAFFLGYGSPIHSNKEDFSIQTLLPHSKNRLLFPNEYIDSMTMLVTSFRGDRVRQRKLWQPVNDKIKAWQEFHQKRSKTKQHPLYFRDGGSFLIIRQERSTSPPLTHRMRGLSRKIYLLCDIPIEKKRLLTLFPTLSEEKLQKFINQMCAKRLMFQEDDRVLSLAVRHRS